MDSSKRHVQKLLVSVRALLAVAAKRACRLPRKLKAAEEWRIELRSPKKLLRGISDKTLPFIPGRGKKKREGEEWGQGGVWQKSILMGDKCEPLDFSGVIYYDSNGKQVNQMPLRSPRASPLPEYYFIRRREPEQLQYHHHH
ncbi:uncharacterized protein LOC109792201 [Cajanus cajan]|uniref:Uncharacterized protein n=1 Tax=Cajanus cajan TaxID=3821 RepID=A0A151QVE5_CAJCA|nr:uncharacterized protein LOC109792201 [Cajanus cajan]KYP34280.1 hypothetical protein KK1_044788 [Cajanus cajan]